MQQDALVLAASLPSFNHAPLTPMVADLSRSTFARGLSLLGLALLLTMMLPDTARGQRLESGPQVLTFFSAVDDTDQPYAIYLPPNFDGSREYPLVISLHGAGSNHRLNLRRVFGKSNAEGENDVEASRYFPEWEDVDYIVASPLARGTMGYQGVAEQDVLDVLADVQRRFPIDEDRTYLTGLSMGGGGTLWLGLTRPDVWAAIAPVCPAPPTGTEDLAPNALNLPIHLFQGDADPVVDPDSVRAWAERFEALNTDVAYTEYPGVGHESWENAYEEGQIFDWFDRFQRDPHPDRVRFATRRYAYDRAYWVRIDALTPGTTAQIDAQFTDPHRVEVTTSALDGFTLHLADHPRFQPDEPVAVQIDGETLEVRAADSLAFSRSEGGWVAEPHAAPVRAKRPGAEGPMSAVIAGRHIYVYGTGDNPSEDELARRQARALEAATWSVDRGPFWGRIKVFPRVVADAEVRDSDLETSNLVLFGTRTTNRLIERFGDRLPLHLDDDATDEYGLTYVFPVGDRYVLVSSGLPWWTSDGANGPASPFTQAVPALRLTGRPDYLLFRDSPETPIVESRFTRTWRLSPEHVEPIQATGVVTVTEEAIEASR